MGALYSHVLQPDRNIRTPFLKAVLRCFDTASDLLTMGAATTNLRQVVHPPISGSQGCSCPDSLMVPVLQQSSVLANSTCSCDQATLASIETMRHWIPCLDATAWKTFLEALMITQASQHACDETSLFCLATNSDCNVNDGLQCHAVSSAEHISPDTAPGLMINIVIHASSSELMQPHILQAPSLFHAHAVQPAL